VAASDTTAEAGRVQRAVLACKTGDERSTMAFEMSELLYRLTSMASTAATPTSTKRK
jgi:hypothetical protein